MHRHGPRSRPAVLTALVLLLAVAPFAAAAEEATSRDPVVAEVLKMLEGQVSSRVIESWLETSGQRPTEVTPEDVIDLTAAGASDRLMEVILEAVEKPQAPEPPPPPPPPPATAPAPEAEPTVDTVTAADESGEQVEARIVVNYSAPGQDEQAEKEWDLYVYLDGKFLAWLPPHRGEGLAFRTVLPAGSHRLLVAQESHQWKKSDTWHHEARVPRESINFHLPPGPLTELEISFHLQWMEKRGQGPLSFTMIREDVQLVEITKAGGDPADYWPKLCEEIEANLAPGKEPSRTMRGELNRCRPWSAIWAGVDGAPDRQTVRDEMARSDFRPIPGR